MMEFLSYLKFGRFFKFSGLGQADQVFVNGRTQPLSNAQDFFISSPLSSRLSKTHTKFYAKFRHPLEKSPPDNSQSESRNSQRSCLTRPIFPKSPQGDFLEHSRTCPGCRKLSNLRLVQTWNTWRHQVAVPSNIRFCPSRTFQNSLEHSRTPRHSDFEPLAYTKSTFVTLRVFKIFVNFFPSESENIYFFAF